MEENGERGRCEGSGCVDYLYSKLASPARQGMGACLLFASLARCNERNRKMAGMGAERLIKATRYLALRRVSGAVSRRPSSRHELGPWRQEPGCPAQSSSIEIPLRHSRRRDFKIEQTRSALYLIPRPGRYKWPARHPVPVLRHSEVRRLLVLDVLDITLDACTGF